MSFDLSVRFGKVLVKLGEIVFADFDGTVVIAHDVGEQVLQPALEEIGKVSLARTHLREGNSLRETDVKFGVL